MPARKLTVATILALVALAAPAHAAYVETIDLDNVVFSGGDIVNGDVYINTNLPFAANTDQNLISIDGLYFFVRTGLTLNSVSGLYYNGPATQNPQSLLETLTVNLADLLNLSISDFTLTNYGQSSPPTYAVSGEVSCASRCSVSATPLPAALPLFGSTLFALVNFAARQSRRTGCG